MFESSQDGASDNDAQDVQTEGSDPSTETQKQDDVNDPQSSSAENENDVNTGTDTSQDQGDKDELSLGDQISNAIDKMAEQDGTKDSPPEVGADKEKKEDDKEKSEKSDKEKGDEQTDKDEISEEEKNAPKEIHEHPAFKKIVQERTAARRERDEALQQIESFKTDAEGFRSLQKYLDEGKVQTQDAINALRLTRLSNENPDAFFREIAAMTQEWGESLGYFLPKDLQAKVKEGLLDMESAKELAKNRGDNRRQSRQIETQDRQIRTQSQNSEAQVHKDLALNWATQKSKSDLELQKKMPLITDRLARMWQRDGKPKTKEEAWSRMETAYTEVNQQLKGFAPPRQKTNQTIPPSTNMKSGGQRAPQSLEEAFDLGFERMEAGSGGM